MNFHLVSNSSNDSFQIWSESEKKAPGYSCGELPEKFWELFRYRFSNFPRLKEFIDNEKLLILTEYLTGRDFTDEIMNEPENFDDRDNSLKTLCRGLEKAQAYIDQKLPKKVFEPQQS